MDVGGIDQFADVIFELFSIRKLLFGVLCLKNAVETGNDVTIYLKRSESQSRKKVFQGCAPKDMWYNEHDLPIIDSGPEAVDHLVVGEGYQRRDPRAKKRSSQQSKPILNGYQGHPTYSSSTVLS